MAENNPNNPPATPDAPPTVQTDSQPPQPNAPDASFGRQQVADPAASGPLGRQVVAADQPIPTTVHVDPTQQQIPHTRAAIYGQNGMLTRGGMDRVLGAGGSVLHNGNVVNDPRQLPSHEDLAQRDVQHAQALLEDARNRRDVVAQGRAQRLLNAAQKNQQTTLRDLDAQMAELQARRDAFAASQQQAAPTQQPAGGKPKK